MIWGAIGYTSRLPLIRIDGTLKSVGYISGVVRPAALLFIRAQRNPVLHQDNARPHVAGPSLRLFSVNVKDMTQLWDIFSDIKEMNIVYDIFWLHYPLENSMFYHTSQF
ncbi:hypothetical protein TNCV_490261 [Trichonephila clavipes]|nr:hypothetical protein TNCV_490261 [Trichonephila clavipes]